VEDPLEDPLAHTLADIVNEPSSLTTSEQFPFLRIISLEKLKTGEGNLGSAQLLEPKDEVDEEGWLTSNFAGEGTLLSQLAEGAGLFSYKPNEHQSLEVVRHRVRASHAFLPLQLKQRLRSLPFLTVRMPQMNLQPRPGRRYLLKQKPVPEESSDAELKDIQTRATSTSRNAIGSDLGTTELVRNQDDWNGPESEGEDGENVSNCSRNQSGTSDTEWEEGLGLAEESRELQAWKSVNKEVNPDVRNPLRNPRMKRTKNTGPLSVPEQISIEMNILQTEGEAEAETSPEKNPDYVLGFENSGKENTVQRLRCTSRVTRKRVYVDATETESDDSGGNCSDWSAEMEENDWEKARVKQRSQISTRSQKKGEVKESKAAKTFSPTAQPVNREIEERHYDEESESQAHGGNGSDWLTKGSGKNSDSSESDSKYTRKKREKLIKNVKSAKRRRTLASKSPAKNEVAEGEGDFHCSLCGKVFVKKRTFQDHLRLQHPDNHRKFPCTACAKVFNKCKDLDKHRRRKHKSHCPICKKVFPSSMDIQAHIKRHEDAQDGDFTCKLCSKKYDFYESLKNHYRREHGEEPPPRSSCQSSSKIAKFYCRKPRTSCFNFIFIFVYFLY